MHTIKTTLLEFAIIAILGTGIGLIANSVNYNGLRIGHNYFEKVAITTRPTTQTTTIPSTQQTTATTHTNQDPGLTDPPERDPVIAYIEDTLGLQAITHDVAVETYFSDAYRQRRFIFIDARDDEQYREGHIPGAYQLDHFFPDRYLPEVLEACSMADRIIVYCNGGECEDSEYAMKILLDAQVNYDRLFIYAHGFKAWKETSLPIEMNERDSGLISGGDVEVSHE